LKTSLEMVAVSRPRKYPNSEQWKYEMQFSEDFTQIESGTLITLPGQMVFKFGRGRDLGTRIV